MSVVMAPQIRLLVSFVVAATLVFVSVLPALAYNGVVVVNVQLTRLDDVQCPTSISLAADLTDGEGNPVVEATVNFTLEEGEPGDVLAPASDVSDDAGRALTTLDLGSSVGTRIVVASVEGDGQDQITIVVDADDCGEVGGVEETVPTLPPTGGILPATSTAEEVAAVVARNLPIGAALAVSIGMLALLYVMGRARGSRPTGTR